MSKRSTLPERAESPAPTTRACPQCRYIARAGEFTPLPTSATSPGRQCPRCLFEGRLTEFRRMDQPAARGRR